MCLHIDEAVHDLHARIFQLRCPMQVLLFVKPRLELDNRSHRFSGLGRFTQGANDGGLLAGTIQRLFNRHDVWIQRRLLQKRQHNVKAFIRVVDNDVFLANRRKTIAVMFQYAFREARGV